MRSLLQHVLHKCVHADFRNAPDSDFFPVPDLRLKSHVRVCVALNVTAV